MSLHALNGENAGEDLAAGNCAMLLTSAETPGRTSILRLSQKENLPPKGIVKPMKVRMEVHQSHFIPEATGGKGIFGFVAGRQNTISQKIRLNATLEEAISWGAAKEMRLGPSGLG